MSKRMSVTLSDEQLLKLDKLSASIGKSRAATLRYVIDNVLKTQEDIEEYSKVGNVAVSSDHFRR